MRTASGIGRALAVGVLAGAFFATPAGAEGAGKGGAAANTIGAEFSVDCTTVTVTTTAKDISNVVVRPVDGDDEKYEGLSGKSWSHAIASGTIDGVFVKSGDNASGAGPGYGEWKDCVLAPSTASNEGPPSANDPPKPAGDKPAKPDVPKDPAPKAEPDADRGGGDAVVGATCVDGVLVVTSTKDISNVVVRTSHGDEKFDGLSGKRWERRLPDGTTTVTVFVKSGDNASGEGPGYGEKVEVVCAANNPPANNPPGNNPPAKNPPAVEGTAIVPQVAFVAEQSPSTRPTEVLGATVTRSAQLARTGSEPTPLVDAGAVLISVGLALVAATRIRRRRPEAQPVG